MRAERVGIERGWILKGCDWIYIWLWVLGVVIPGLVVWTGFFFGGVVVEGCGGLNSSRVYLIYLAWNNKYLHNDSDN